MALIRHDEERFAGLIQAAAADRGLGPGLVEKDYWAVEALRATRMPIAVPVGTETVHVQTVFKGGTSLPKAFGLIDGALLRRRRPASPLCRWRTRPATATTSARTSCKP